MKSTHCFVTDADRRRLGSLLTNRENWAWGTRRRRLELNSLLEESSPIEPHVAPETLVTMNTTVELQDLKSARCRVVTLVYPQDADVVPDGVSILDPLGVALIGCRKGEVLQYSGEHGNSRLRVVKILQQPEQVGLWHL